MTITKIVRGYRVCSYFYYAKRSNNIWASTDKVAIKWLMLESQLKFLTKIKWLSLQSSWCTWDVPETFLTFNEGRRCMDTIHERKNTFTFYYTSSILLKGWIERAGSWMKGKILYKTKHNKTISQQSPDSWLFAILFLFLFCCTHTFVGVYKTTEKHVLVQHTWNRILDFKMFFCGIGCVLYIHKTSGTKIHAKSIFMNVWWEISVFFLLRLIFSGCLSSFDLFWIKRLSFKSLPITVLS